MTKDLETRIRKITPKIDDAIRSHLGFSLDALKNDLIDKLVRVPGVGVDISTDQPYKQAKEAFLRAYLYRQLSIHLGNVAATADALAIDRRTLHRLALSLKIPLTQIRNDKTKRSYLAEENVTHIVKEVFKSYSTALHPEKVEQLHSYAPVLSKDIAGDIIPSSISFDDALTAFEREYFAAIMRKQHTVAAAARFCLLRPETLHRKLKDLGLKGEQK